jgi:hypothetical protein
MVNREQGHVDEKKPMIHLGQKRCFLATEHGQIPGGVISPRAASIPNLASQISSPPADSKTRGDGAEVAAGGLSKHDG